jgi:hypothetical protein
MGYSHEEVEQVQVEHEQLRVSWTRFLDEMLNGTTLERHVPPALMSACMKIVESQAGINIGPTDNPTLGVAFQTMADYGATMFVFGQFCMRDGFLSGNMVPCACDHIDDEELSRFIDKS